MNERRINDITRFIFLRDEPQPCDLILIPGTSKAAITERAAELYHQGLAPYVLPSGRFSSALGHFAGRILTINALAQRYWEPKKSLRRMAREDKESYALYLAAMMVICGTGACVLTALINIFPIFDPTQEGESYARTKRF